MQCIMSHDVCTCEKKNNLAPNKVIKTFFTTFGSVWKSQVLCFYFFLLSLYIKKIDKIITRKAI